MSEFEYMSCDDAVLIVLIEGPCWFNEIQRLTGIHKKTLKRQLDYLKKEDLVTVKYVRNKIFYSLTLKGKDA